MTRKYITAFSYLQRFYPGWLHYPVDKFTQCQFLQTGFLVLTGYKVYPDRNMDLLAVLPVEPVRPGRILNTDAGNNQ